MWDDELNKLYCDCCLDLYSGRVMHTCPYCGKHVCDPCWPKHLMREHPNNNHSHLVRSIGRKQTDYYVVAGAILVEPNGANVTPRTFR